MAPMDVNSTNLVSGQIVDQHSSASKFAAGAKMIEQLSDQTNQAQPKLEYEC